MGTVAGVVRRAGLALADAVATVAQAVVLRHIPASLNPEASNMVVVTEEPNQTVLTPSANIAVVTPEPNQVTVLGNGVNTISVEEAA